MSLGRCCLLATLASSCGRSLTVQRLQRWDSMFCFQIQESLWVASISFTKLDDKLAGSYLRTPSSHPKIGYNMTHCSHALCFWSWQLYKYYALLSSLPQFACLAFLCLRFLLLFVKGPKNDEVRCQLNLTPNSTWAHTWEILNSSNAIAAQ